MAKKKIRRAARSISAAPARDAMIRVYRERFYNLWMGAWRWKGLNRYQRDFVMRKLWEDGRIAAFDIIRGMKPFEGGIAPADEGDNSLLGFAPFAPCAFNMYEFPSRVNLINVRGVPYIPEEEMKVDEDVVLGWALHSRRPLREVVDIYIEKIVDVEMTIRTNLFGHKIPYTLECEDERDAQGNDLIRRVMNDEVAFIVRPGQSPLKPAGTGQNYIIDKLYNYKVALENELSTFLGVDNIGGVEKKERLVTAETDSQDAIINDFSDSIGENLNEMNEKIGDVLGFDIEAEPTASPRASEKEAMETAEEENTMNEEDSENEKI